MSYWLPLHYQLSDTFFIVQQFKTPWEWLPNTSNSSHAIYTLQRKTQYHKAQLHKSKSLHLSSSKQRYPRSERIILQHLQDVKPLPPICFWDSKGTIKHRSKITVRKSTMIILKNYPFHSSNEFNLHWISLKIFLICPLFSSERITRKKTHWISNMLHDINKLVEIKIREI